MQKFQKGDHVRVAKNLGSGMRHFQGDCEAIVMFSYSDKFGGENNSSYALFIKDQGETAWYYESQLTLIKAGKFDLLEEWRIQKQKEIELKSNLDWIFDNGKDVIKEQLGCSVQALANCFGLTDLWGSRGEGFQYFENSRITMMIAEPFLKNSDKEGWLKFCEKIVEGNNAKVKN